MTARKKDAVEMFRRRGVMPADDVISAILDACEERTGKRLTEEWVVDIAQKVVSESLAKHEDGHSYDIRKAIENHLATEHLPDGMRRNAEPVPTPEPPVTVTTFDSKCKGSKYRFYGTPDFPRIEHENIIEGDKLAVIVMMPEGMIQNKWVATYGWQHLIILKKGVYIEPMWDTWRDLFKFAQSNALWLENSELPDYITRIKAAIRKFTAMSKPKPVPATQATSENAANGKQVFLTKEQAEVVKKALINRYSPIMVDPEAIRLIDSLVAPEPSKPVYGGFGIQDGVTIEKNPEPDGYFTPTDPSFPKPEPKESFDLGI